MISLVWCCYILNHISRTEKKKKKKRKRKMPLRRWMHFGDGLKTKGTHKCWLGAFWVKGTFTMGFFVWMGYQPHRAQYCCSKATHLSSWCVRTGTVEESKEKLLWDVDWCLILYLWAECLYFKYTHHNRSSLLHINTVTHVHSWEPLLHAALAWHWYSQSCPSHRMSLSPIYSRHISQTQNSHWACIALH